jgi:AcrR family transcriptional regulator
MPAVKAPAGKAAVVNPTGVKATAAKATAVSPAKASPGGTPAAEPAAHRRPGRPRSEEADRPIIDAALSLFAESGADGLCIEQVAARAGVGKATIYRRWPGKEDLLLDALATLKVPLPTPQGRSVGTDLVALLDAMGKESADPRRARLFALLQGEGLRYPRLMARYMETVVEPRRDVVRSVLRRGVATGELREETDIEAALFMLSGAVLARGRYGQEPIEAGYPRRVVDELLRGLASR